MKKRRILNLPAILSQDDCYHTDNFHIKQKHNTYFIEVTKILITGTLGDSSIVSY